MTDLFLKVLNLSFSASWVVLAVVLARLVLKKAPRSLVCALWAMVALRLIFGGIEAPFSLLPSTQIIPPESLFDQAPMIDSGIPVLDNAVNPIYSESLRPMPGASINPLQVWLAVYANLWVLGMAAMALWACISCLRVRRQVRESVPDGPVYLCDRISSPFIFGLLRPKIYLPSNLSETARSHVLAHEMAHIARRDHWWKPLGFALLTVNWFNPAMWLSYVLLCRDIEMACDERVVRFFGAEEKKAYSAALLSCSVNARPITACPLSFGEVGVKQRIRSVLSYKKPAFWVILLAAVLIAVVALGFLTDPLSPDPEIRFGGVLYVQEGRTAKTLPESAEPIGTLRSILHDQPGPGSLHANEDNQAVHLQWEYAGQPMHLSDGTLYIEKPGGKGWLPFVQKHSPEAVFDQLQHDSQCILYLQNTKLTITETLSRDGEPALLALLKAAQPRMQPSMEWEPQMLANNFVDDICINIDTTDFTQHCLLLRRENDWLMVYRDESWAVSAWAFESPELDDFLDPRLTELRNCDALFAPFAAGDGPIWMDSVTAVMGDISLHCVIPTSLDSTLFMDTSSWMVAHISHLDGTIQIQCPIPGREDWMEIHYRSEAEPLYTYGFEQMPLTLANGATGTLYHGNDPDRWTEVVLDTTVGQLYATAPNPALQQTDWTTEDYRMALAILGTLSVIENGSPMYGQQEQPHAYLNREFARDPDYLINTSENGTYSWQTLQGQEKEALRVILNMLSGIKFNAVEACNVPKSDLDLLFMLDDGLTCSFQLSHSDEDTWTLSYFDTELGNQYWEFQNEALSAWAAPYLLRSEELGSIFADQPNGVVYYSAEYDNLTMTVGIPDNWTSTELPETVFGGRFGLRCRPVRSTKWMDITFYDTEDTLYDSSPYMSANITLSNGAAGRLYHSSDPTRWDTVVLETPRGQLHTTAPGISYATTDWTQEDYQTALQIIETLTLTQDGVSLFPSRFPDKVDRPLGITLHAENITQNGCTLVCTQSGGPFENILTGSQFNLERLEDNRWVGIMPESTVWTAIAYMVNRDTTTTWTLNWSQIVGSLAPGHYRVSKTFWGESRNPFHLGEKKESGEQTYYAEFTIE